MSGYPPGLDTPTSRKPSRSTGADQPGRGGGRRSRARARVVQAADDPGAVTRAAVTRAAVPRAALARAALAQAALAQAAVGQAAEKTPWRSTGTTSDTPSRTATSTSSAKPPSVSSRPETLPRTAADTSGV